MGNKLGRRRQVVDEKYTRPQGLYVHKDVDVKKLRKLILESKLAPCYPGNEECPFCKTSNYAVEYRGVKTKEEKGIEQIEEQRVIEAQIRMRQQELQDDEERMQKRQEFSSSSTAVSLGEVQYGSAAAQSSVEEELVSSQDSQVAMMIRQPSHPRTNRDDEFDVDLEEIMVMEAIWQSIQENSRHRKSNNGDAASSVHVSVDRYVSPAMATVAGSSSSSSSSSPSGGFACAVAALAERQQISGESSLDYNGNIPPFNMLPGSSRFYNRLDRVSENRPAESPVDMPTGGLMTPARDEGEWGVDFGSEVAEAGTSYASPDVTEDIGGISTIPQQDEIRGSFLNVPRPIVPESYEEQMMLAMAVSLSEAKAMTSNPGVPWQ
ncbi:hypothetical protein Gogos_009183 [Gossypium gossypioides]|uniref:Uncharacterized protein n=1 Tax=Gossypium gossypioides TaxID=34282 RepID=A0A7J9CE54_GOSGO|nr:hypothetical protein [Gossypium gossypioides]